MALAAGLGPEAKGIIMKRAYKMTVLATALMGVSGFASAAFIDFGDLGMYVTQQQYAAVDINSAVNTGSSVDGSINIDSQNDITTTVPTSVHAGAWAPDATATATGDGATADMTTSATASATINAADLGNSLNAAAFGAVADTTFNAEQEMDTSRTTTGLFTGTSTADSSGYLVANTAYNEADVNGSINLTASGFGPNDISLEQTSLNSVAVGAVATSTVNLTGAVRP